MNANIRNSNSNSYSNRSEYMRRAQLKKNRRTRQLRRRLAILTFIVCLTGSFGIFGMTAHAQSKDEIQVYKYYKSVVVKSNDSLWNYAVENAKDSNYEKYIAEVERMNNLNSDEIITGMNLIIPYYSLEFIEK